MTYTVKEINHALQGGSWRGTFASLEDARTYAEKQAARCQTFMEYQVCEGTPKHPGKQVGGSIRREVAK